MASISDNQRRTLLDKLAGLDERFRQIDLQMHDPAVATDMGRLVPLTKERARLIEVVELYRRYLGLRRQQAEAEQLAGEEAGDAEMRKLAEEEAAALRAESEQLLGRIIDNLLAGEGPAVDSTIIEIRAGTGGDEAALFAGDLLTLYEKYCARRGYKTEILSASPTEIGGFREVLVGVKGAEAYRRLRFEAGGHRVQRVPVTEAQGRIHTSAATVAVLPEYRDVRIDIKPDEVREDVSRAGGPGGQNVNKVASAIRLTHLPTGIAVSMRDERSQHKNREKAWRVLRSRLYEHFAAIERAKREATRKSMVGSGDRSDRVRTYNYPQNRLTDHRTGQDLYRLDQIMSTGDLDEVIDALLLLERQEQLANL